MGTRLSVAASAVVLFSGFLSSAALAADTHKLARSNELGVEIDAMGGDEWCRLRLSLTITAQTAGIYATTDFADLIKKLGQVLETECPQARHADISGLDANNQLIFEGNASASNEWVVSQSWVGAQSNETVSTSNGTDWAATLSGWLNALLEWALSLNPSYR